MGKNVYAFTINEESVWHTSVNGSYDIDTIGYSDVCLFEALSSFDILWNPMQFSEGFETIFVVNPSVLEISAMAGGAVEGGASPFGKKKKKIPERY